MLSKLMAGCRGNCRLAHEGAYAVWFSALLQFNMRQEEVSGHEFVYLLYQLSALCHQNRNLAILGQTVEPIRPGLSTPWWINMAESRGVTV